MHRRFAAGLAFVGLLALPTHARAATCGNGIVDFPDEACDEGAANGTDDCCSATCQTVDSDGDGICDRYDHYDTDFGFVVDGTAPRPRLRVSGLGRLPADTTLRYTAVTTAPTVPFDLAADGLGVGFRAQFIFPDLVDVVLPAGAGWTRSAGSWSYRDPTGAVAGIVGVRVTRRSGGRLAWRILGRHMAFGLTPADLTFSGQLRVTLTAAPAAEAVVAAMHWRTPPTGSPCTFAGAARTLACNGPPHGPSCQPGTPDDMVRCTVRSAGHGQDVYYAGHGTYFTGRCNNLPAFTQLLPGLVCSTTGGAASYVAWAAHPAMHFLVGCYWCPANPSLPLPYCPDGSGSFGCP